MEHELRGAVEHAATWYLKYFKGLVVVVMTLVLFALVAFMVLAAINFTQEPVPPTPAKLAPERKVDFSEFVKYMLEREQQKKNDDDRQKRDKDIQFVPSSSAAPAVKYLEQATQFYRCTEEFGKKSSDEVAVVSVEEANKRIEGYRQTIESSVGKPFLGEAWLVDFLQFSCAALRNPELIALKKDRKLTSLPVFIFHTSVYAAIQRDKEQFENSEKQRVELETGAEEIRVSLAKARGVFFAMLAGGAFSTLFALALFLILSRIESNLADMAQSLRDWPGNRLLS